MNSLPRRAAMYARVSSHRQQKQSTIQSQVTQLRCRIEEDGHQLLEEHILLDDGYSGSYLDRPGLDRLRDLVRDRAIDLIYIHSPDRLARRYVHQVVLMEEFERFGCQVAFFQQTPSKDPDSQLLVQIQGVIAEYERAKIAERLRRGKLYHARQGAILSWKAPYGYRYVHYEGEPGRWEINEDEAPLIRELFGWLRDEALSVRQATKRLQASPWKPRAGRLWSTSSVREILTNETYIGISYYNRRRWVESDRTDWPLKKNRKTKSILRPREEWIAIAVPALIDKDTFQRVQEQLKKNKAFSRRNLRRDGEYLLRCLVSCGVCGRSMVVHSYGRHTYYQCGANVDPVTACRAERCPSPMVYAPDLDRVVWEEIESLLRSPQLMTETWEHQRRGAGLLAPDLVEAEADRLQKQIEAAGRQIRRLVDGYQTGLVRSTELAKRRAHLEEKIAHWTEQRCRLESERPKWKEWKAVTENLSRFCDHVLAGLTGLTFEEKQKLLRKVMERVIVTGGEVTLKLAIPLSTNLDLTPVGIHYPQNAPALLPSPPRSPR